MLGHVDLGRRESHECANAKRSDEGSGESPGKNDAEKKCEHTEKRGDLMQRIERFTAEKRMPDISRKYVKKPDRRQNRAGKRLLNLDVVINHGIVRGDPGADETVDVAAIDVFIETGFDEPGLRMKEFEPMKAGSWIREKG